MVRGRGWGGAGGRLLVWRRRGVVAVGALAALNLADAVLTAAALDGGLAQEANPVMRLAWEASPYVFFGLKTGLVAGALAVLLRLGGSLAAGLTLHAALGTYGVVVGYHVAFWGTRLLT